MKADLQQLKVQAGFEPYEERLEGWMPNGNEYRAWCPWHEQSHTGNPSLAVFPDKQLDGAYSFKCMAGCDGKVGDVLKFVQLVEGVPFGETIRRLSEEVGLEEPKQEHFEYDKEKAVAALWQDQAAIAYLAGRGIDEQTARRAGVGIVEHHELGLSLSIPYDDEVVKFRAVNPSGKDKKFRHIKGKPSHDSLYGINSTNAFDGEVYVTESELDCLTLKAHGFNAVSVSSATTCLDNEGNLAIRQEHLDELGKFEKILLILDSDVAGRKCAAAFRSKFPKWQLLDVYWEHEKDDDTPKDIGEVYSNAPTDFCSNVESLLKEASTRPPEWRKRFHTFDELPDGDIIEFIKGFLTEGITGIGSPSGVGKTLLGMSMVKALNTGRSLFGVFSVTEPVNTLYLCPEMIGKMLRKRAKLFGITFGWGKGKNGVTALVQSMEDGITPLNDPQLAEVIAELKPVVFLDTAIRFTSRTDENSASENAEGLAKSLFLLLQYGAKAVVFLHHSPKGKQEESMTLENIFRGTGDIGAMCDTAWGIRWDDGRNNQAKNGSERYKEESQALTRLFVKNLKPRDMDPVPPFRIQGRPYIDDDGDFVVLKGVVDGSSEPTDTKASRLVAAIQAKPKANNVELARASGYSRNHINRVAKSLGWVRNDSGEWQEKLKQNTDPLFPTDDPANIPAILGRPYD
jgi:hypothetical protein